MQGRGRYEGEGERREEKRWKLSGGEEEQILLEGRDEDERGVKQRKRVAEVVQKIRRASRSRRAQAGPTGAGNGMTSQREVQRQVWTRNLELKEEKGIEKEEYFEVAYRAKREGR